MLQNLIPLICLLIEFQMKGQRDALKEKYIREGKILADDAKVSLNDAVSLVGECLDMCPEFERHEREYQRGLHPLEKIPGTELVDHQRAVKRYRRSASDGHTLLPCDKTLDYLFHNVIAEHGLQESQPFVRDRTRGIRNDFTLQNYRQMEAIVCHERIARYHIVVASQLIAHEGFSLQQEMEQIRKTLQSLREYYTDMRKESIPCPNEAEFQAYYILSHIWNNDIATLAETLPFHIFNDPRVQLALEFQHLAQCSTAPVFKGMKRSLGSLSFYTRFFAKVADTRTSYLVAALLHQEFDRVRCNALRSMNRVLWDLEPRVSLVELAALLGYDDVQEVATVLEYYEVKVEETMEGEWVACLGKDPPTKSSKLRSKTFQDGKRVSLQPRPSIRLVGSKAAGVQIQDIIDGFDVGLAKPVPPPEGYSAKSSIAPPFTPPTIKKQIPATANSFSNTKPKQNRDENSLATLNGQIPSSFSTGIASALPISSNLQPAMDASASKSQSKSAFGGSSVFGSSVFGKKAVGAKSGVFSNLSPTAQEVKPQNTANSATETPNPTSEPNNLANPIGLPNFLSNKNKTEPALPAISSVVLPSNSQGFFAELTTDTTKQFSAPQIVPQPNPPTLPSFAGFGALNTSASVSSSGNQLPSRPAFEFPIQPLSKEPQHLNASISFHLPTAPVRIDSAPQQSQPIPTPLSAKPQPATQNEIDLINAFIDDEIIAMLRETVHTDQQLIQPWANELILQVLDDQTATIVQEVYESLQVAHSEAVAADCLRRQASAFRTWFCVAQRRAVKREEGEKRRREKAARFYRDVLLGSAFLNCAPLVTQRPTKVASSRSRVRSPSPPPPRPQIDVTQFMYLDIPKLVLEPLWTKTYGPTNQSIPPKEKATPPQLQWKLAISTPSFYTQDQQEDLSSDFNRIASLWTCSKFGAGGDGSGDSRVGMAPSRWIGDETTDESDSWRQTGRHSSLSNGDARKEVGGYVLHELRRLCVDLQVSENSGVPSNMRKAAAKDVRLSVHVTHVHVAQEAAYPLKENYSAVSSGTRAVLFQLSMFDWETGIEMSAWWEAERERLYSLLSTLPLGAQVPLVLWYFPSASLSAEEFVQDVTTLFNLESILVENGGPVTAIDVRTVPMRRENEIEFLEAVDLLERCVVWMAEKSEPQPFIRSQIVKDFIEPYAADSVRLALNRIEVQMSDLDFVLDVSAHVSTFNTIVKMYNAQLEGIASLLTNKENGVLPWPCAELSAVSASSTNLRRVYPPTSWNSLEALETVQTALKSFRLPLMQLQQGNENIYGDSNNASTNFQIIKQHYQEYIGTLSQSSLVSNSNSLLSILWTRLAQFEKTRLFSKKFASAGNASTSFPLSKVGLALISDGVEALKTLLQQLGRKISGGVDELQSPWYNWHQIPSVASELTLALDAIVSDWETSVLEPWKHAVKFKDAVTNGSPVSSVESRPSLFREDRVLLTPTPKSKRPTFQSESWTPSVHISSPSSIRYGTPLPKALLEIGEDTNPGFSPAAKIVQPHPYVRQSPHTSALKRRMQETIALCRLEAEKTKRLAK
ncbi:hypothetical protein HDU81_008825 [Chytriomyces hyalinus]|nr:hypothetical protein HDU81_008825 [Chytriomyces hyalinus]